MFGFYRICCAVPQLRLADVQFNAAEIESLYIEAAENGAAAVLFPELSLTGASCGNIFYQKSLLDNVRLEIVRLSELTKNAVLIFGAPLVCGNALWNCAIVAQCGRILGIIPKKRIGNDAIFADGMLLTDEIVINGDSIEIGADMLFSDGNFTFGVTVGEDLNTALPQASCLCVGGADVIFNLSCCKETANNWQSRSDNMISFSSNASCAYVYASSGSGESVTDCVYAGHCCIVENGELLTESRPFARISQLIYDEIDVEKIQAVKIQKSVASSGADSLSLIECYEIETADKLEYRYIEPMVFVPEDTCELDNIIKIQTFALADRISRINAKTMVLGISGGLDSTLALLICHNVCKELGMPFTDIVAFTLPGFGTSGRTYNNAVNLAKELGVTLKEVNIREAALQHFKDIGHDVNDIDVTYENTQARERTQILMDYANKSGGIVIGTGDLSESALGWCTYNGDHMSMYGLNSSVPKTQIRPLISYYAENCNAGIREILQDIIDTPVSPELLPPSETGDIVQKTEDIIGPYELHDFFLYHFIQFGTAPAKLLFMAERAFAGVYEKVDIVRTLRIFIRRFFTQQFKRNAVPDGVQTGVISLSPRGSWNMPSEADCRAFLAETEADNE